MIDKDKITYEIGEIEQLYSCKNEYSKLICIRNMRDFLARKNANQLWGGGYRFETQNEALQQEFEQWAKQNRLQFFFHFVETQLSLHGRAILTINKTKTGEIRLNIANPFFYCAIGNTFVTEQLAVIWQRIIYDNKAFYVKSIYDTQKVVNQIYNEQNQIMVFGEFRELAPDVQLEEVWYHNLGFVPVVQITNYPIILYDNYRFDNNAFINLSDWYPATMFEETFYVAWKNLNKELKYCHSRVGIENANQQLIEQIKTYDESGDGIIGDYVIETETGGKIQAIPGVGDFTKYTSAMNQIMDFYFKFANSSKFSEGGGAQKTSAEAQDSKSSTIETLKTKIEHREFDFSMLIAKVMAAMGKLDYFSPWDFVFKINGNIERQENAYVDLLIKQVQAGLMSIPEAISLYRNVSSADAQKIFENIKSFNEENNVVVSTIMSEQEQDMLTSGGFDRDSNEGGRPTDVE